MNVQLYHSALENEAEAAARVRELKRKLDAAKREKSQFSETLSPFAVKIGFIGKGSKAKQEQLQRQVASLQRDLSHREMLLDQIQTELTMVKKNEMDMRRDPILAKGQQVYGFYVKSRQRMADFKKRVHMFLVALGEARGAMSANYNKQEAEYSTAAKQRIAEAIPKAEQVDQALTDIERLDEEFRYAAQGSRYEEIQLPQFAHVNYRKFLEQLTAKPIMDAYMDFIGFHDACKQLGATGIDEAMTELDEVEEKHQRLTDEIVVMTWQADQREFLGME